LATAKKAKVLDKAEVCFVDVSGAKQSVIRIGCRAMVANARKNTIPIR
jgi:hypothetical protein